MTQIRILRITGIAEGISFLVLLLIAMPLKYWVGLPTAVKIVGWLHGMLFIAFVIMVFRSAKVMKWGPLGMLLALAASLVPLGTFFLDKSLKERENSLSGQQT